MRHDSYNSNLNSLNERNKIQTYVIGIITVVLAISVYSNVTTHDRLVFIPQGLPANASVSWDTADPIYMNMTAASMAQLVGSINPKNLRYIVDSLSKIVEPGLYSELRKKLLAKEKNPVFNHSGASTSFTLTETPIYEPADNGQGGTSFVFGNQSSSNFYQKVEHQPYIYEISLRIVNGAPVIYKIDSYPGTEARTKDWLAKHPDFKKPEGE